MSSPWDPISRIQEAYARDKRLLAHLYWRERHPFFEQGRIAYTQGKPWGLKATPYHGVHQPERPTLNFFVVDDAWIAAYALAAETRDLRHGLLVRRSAVENLARRPGYELEQIRVGYPGKYGVSDPREFWRFDLGNHRFKALDAMRFSAVERLATPEEEAATFIDIPHESVVAWW